MVAPKSLPLLKSPVDYHQTVFDKVNYFKGFTMPGTRRKKRSPKKNDRKKLSQTISRLNGLTLDEEVPELPSKQNYREVVEHMQRSRRDNFLSQLIDANPRSIASLRSGRRSGPALDIEVSKNFSKQELEDLKMVFDSFDVNGTGSLDFVQFERLLLFLRCNVRNLHLRELVEELSLENNGEYGLNELLQCLSCGLIPRDYNLEISQGFRKFDREDTGSITIDNLKHLNATYAMGLSEQELEDMIKQADRNGDGTVDEKEFKAMMLKTNIFS